MESFNRTRWLDKFRPAGASRKADGPEGLMAPIVTTGISVAREKTFSRVILVLGAMLIFLYRSTEDPRIVRVILAPNPCNFRRLEKKEPCLSFNQCLHFSNYACQPCTGPCKYSSNLVDHVSQIVIQVGPCCSSTSSKINSVRTSHPCTKGHAKFLCAFQKKRATDSM